MTIFTPEFIAQQRELANRGWHSGWEPDRDIYNRAAANHYPDALEEIERLREAQNAECHWHQEDDDWGLWIGECGAAWEFTDDGPVENCVNFCPKCGKKLVIAEKGGE